MSITCIKCKQQVEAGHECGQKAKPKRARKKKATLPPKGSAAYEKRRNCALCGVVDNGQNMQGTLVCGLLCCSCSKGPRECWQCGEIEDIAASFADGEYCRTCWISIVEDGWPDDWSKT